jgi:hypothetical protein
VLSEEADEGAVAGELQRCRHPADGFGLGQQFHGPQQSPLLAPGLVAHAGLSHEDAAYGLVTGTHPFGQPVEPIGQGVTPLYLLQPAGQTSV